MLRHGLAALVLLALLTPLVPVAGGPMTCCRGTGESCVCPLTPGFARCDVVPTATPSRSLLAVLPSVTPSLAPAVSFGAPASPVASVASLVLPPLVPPPW